MDKYIESLCSIAFIAPPPVHIIACRLDNRQSSINGISVPIYYEQDNVSAVG